MFFIDKYNNDIIKLYENKFIKQFIDLYKNNIQNIIIYGKNTNHISYIKNNLLNRIYSKDECKLKDIEYEINNFNNIKNQVIIKQSLKHIIIKPKNNGLDKYIIQNVIKKFVSYNNLLNFGDTKCKFVIIDKINNLDTFSQSSLRRMIEKYYDRCRFIFISDNISKIMEPLLSRCLLIRIKLLNTKEIIPILNKIIKQENIIISKEKIDEIMSYYNNNLKEIICCLELYKNNYDTKLNWLELIKKLSNIVYNTKDINLDFINEIKSKFYILYISNIAIKDIIMNIMSCLLKLEKDVNIRYKIIELTSEYELRLNIGTRKIIHFETYIYNIILLIHFKKFNIDKFKFF
jgi:replication factor C subunit 3/5